MAAFLLTWNPRVYPWSDLSADIKLRRRGPARRRKWRRRSAPSSRLSKNVVQEKKDDAPRVERLYSAQLTQPMSLRQSPRSEAPPVAAASGAALRDAGASKERVLRREGGYVEVRDERGNQGWVSAGSVK